MNGINLQELLKNANGDPAKVWPEVEKMMGKLKAPKTGLLEIPIILTKYSKKEDDELSRLLNDERDTELDIEEIDSSATINIQKCSSFHKSFVGDIERAFLSMDNGETFETRLTYNELKELLNVD